MISIVLSSIVGAVATVAVQAVAKWIVNRRKNDTTPTSTDI